MKKFNKIFKSNEFKKIYDYLEKTIVDYPIKMDIENLEDYSKKLSKNAEVFFLKNNNNIIGMLAFYKNDLNNQLYISSISITKEHQLNGFGQIFLDFLIEEAYKINMKIIKLEVNILNQKAISFYLKNNFHVIEENNNSFFMEMKI